MDVAVGIDVGFSPNRRSTGVVVINRATKALAAGTIVVVDTAKGATSALLASLVKLKPATATLCVDGPFAAPTAGNSRQIECLFCRGPFWSMANPPLRVNPGQTKPGSAFLLATQSIVGQLQGAGFVPMTLANGAVGGQIIEIFPTLYMAALLPPHAYAGSRNSHTDVLWLTLIGKRAFNGAPLSVHPLLRPYAALIQSVEACAPGLLHDARAAAISAIAADLHAAAPAGSGAAKAVTFIGNSAEKGFIMPPASDWDPSFMQMTRDHYQALRGALPGMSWV